MQTESSHRNTFSVLATLILVTAFLGSAISYGIVYAYHLVIAAHFLAMILTGNLKNFAIHSWIKNPIWILLSSYSVISILWAPNLSSALQYNGYWLSGCYMILACDFEVKVETWVRVSKALSILFVCHLVLALLEIFTPVRWPISEYSKLIYYFGRPVKDYYSFFENYPTSFFWHQNNCALVTLLGIPLVLKSSYRFRLLILIACYLVIFFSGSKSVLILAVGYGLYYLMKTLYFTKFRLGIRKIFITCLMASVSIYFAYFFANDAQKTELLQVASTVEGYIKPGPEFLYRKLRGERFDFSQLNENIRERYYFMDGALDILSTSPLFGAGAGAHLAARYQKNNQNLPLRSIHNYWLEIFTCFGPFFFLAYAYALWTLIRKNSKYRESIVLFILGTPVLASAIYFLPKWLLYTLSNSRRDANG